jgi:hypothetical protein
MFLHWIAPANLLLRRRLIYRITDFHPSAPSPSSVTPPLAAPAYWATIFWRRRVTSSRCWGHDQAQHLRDIGIADDRIASSPIRRPSPSRRTPSRCRGRRVSKASTSCSTRQLGHRPQCADVS